MMEKIAYFDCFSGISGDMCLGAVVDAGAPLGEIIKKLKKMPIKGYRLSAEKVSRSHFSATKVNVIIPQVKNRDLAHGGERGRRWRDIEGIIKSSSLPDEVGKKGLGIFKRLFLAEAKVHGEAFHKVHLHELGAVDCLVDVFGTLIGLELLGVKEVYASYVNLGGGAVRTEHGTLPIPAPATAEILRDVPVYSAGTPFEMTTPTGAAIVKSLSKGFGEMPVFIPEKIGVGAGSREIEGRANILRVFIGTRQTAPADETVTVIETNIDDMNPQLYGYVFEELFKKGARDVFMSHIMMKKMRPGIKLSVLCDREKRDNLIQLILRETTSIGVRYYETERVTMDRRVEKADTKYGKVSMKVSDFGNSIRKVMPEYEECRKLAKKSGQPLLTIFEETKRDAMKKK
jgi:pyridinium-3,5-bisthiocarboxylic acid mononucleotide nickel chelatase